MEGSSKGLPLDGGRFPDDALRRSQNVLGGMGVLFEDSPDILVVPDALGLHVAEDELPSPNLVDEVLDGLSHVLAESVEVDAPGEVRLHQMVGVGLRVP